VSNKKIAELAADIQSGIGSGNWGRAAIENAIEELLEQEIELWRSSRIAELEHALRPFASHFEGPLDSVGGGTLVSVPFPLQAFKEAQKALKR